MSKVEMVEYLNEHIDWLSCNGMEEEDLEVWYEIVSTVELS